jgi:ParB family transcriptional regulator, chromosome partitioning protein
MKKDNKIIKENLSQLLNKFAKSDVIEAIEKEYASKTSNVVKLDLIDDNDVLKNVLLNQQLIKNMAESINAQGVLNPLIVRPKGQRYELVVGRKRYLAAKLAKLEEIPVITKFIDDHEMLLMLLVFARDSRDTNAILIAKSCQQLHDRYGYTQNELAKVTHVSRPQITNLLRLLKLPQPIIDKISRNELSYGHAKAMLTMPHDILMQLSKRISEQKLSVRDIERIAYQTKNETFIKRLEKKYSVKTNLGRRHLTFKFTNNEKLQEFIEELLKQ